MASLHRSRTVNAASVGAYRPRGKSAEHIPTAVLREVAAVIAAAVGLAVGINIVLRLLHVGFG